MEQGTFHYVHSERVQNDGTQIFVSRGCYCSISHDHNK